MYHIISIEQAGKETEIEVLLTFESLDDAITILKALEQVNYLFHCYGIASQDQMLKLGINPSRKTYITNKPVEFKNHILKEQ